MDKDFYSKVSEEIAKYNPTSTMEEVVIVTDSDVSESVVRKLFAGDIYDVEKFYVVFLNQRNQVIHSMLLSMGGMVGTVVDIRKIFREALICKATSIILSHNHPSGQLTPSQADITITQKIKKAGDIMEIKVLDHIIIAGDSFYSFADNCCL